MNEQDHLKDAALEEYMRELPSNTTWGYAAHRCGFEAGWDSAIERSRWVAVGNSEDLPKVDGLYAWATATSEGVNYFVAYYRVSYKDSWHISGKQSWFLIEPYTQKEQI